MRTPVASAKTAHNAVSPAWTKNEFSRTGCERKAMQTDQTGPVTVVVRHLVKQGREPEFEAWLRGITTAMLQFEGQQGYNVVRPTGKTQPEYLVFFRFDSFENLEKWEHSSERREWLDRLESLSSREPLREQHTGLEVWFSPPSGRPFPRWKMVAVTLLAIYPLISLVQLLLVPILPDWPILLRTLVTSTLLVFLMTYIVMPIMTQLFAPWLYGSR
jgi:antibiotic biosynthesis monooxygenase (ABM) superfamily enzyme